MNEKPNKLSLEQILAQVDVAKPSSIQILWGIHQDRLSGRMELPPAFVVKVEGEEVIRQSRVVTETEISLISQLVINHGVDNLILFIPGGDKEAFEGWLEAIIKSEENQTISWSRDDK